MAARISGDVDLSESAAVLAVAEAKSAFPYGATTARLGLALLAAQRGDVAGAQEQYAALESQRGLMLVLGGMANDRLLGLLARTMGQLDQAALHFEDALIFCREAGYRPELAWAGHDYAHALLQRINPGDREKAMSLLDEALAISTELGMRPLTERVVALQARTESPAVQAPVYPDGMTLREVDVLRLVASGKTDREIADELVVAEGTVGRHISNIYAKTDVSNRSEATRYALRKQLLSLEEAPPQ